MLRWSSRWDNREDSDGRVAGSQGVANLVSPGRDRHPPRHDRGGAAHHHQGHIVLANLSDRPAIISLVIVGWVALFDLLRSGTGSASVSTYS